MKNLFIMALAVVAIIGATLLTTEVVQGLTKNESHERTACYETSRLIFGSSTKYVTSTSLLYQIDQRLAKFVPKLTSPNYVAYGDPAILTEVNELSASWQDFKQNVSDLRKLTCHLN